MANAARYIERSAFCKATHAAPVDDVAVCLVKGGALDASLGSDRAIKGLDELVAFLAKDGVDDDGIAKATDGVKADDVSFPFVLSTAAEDRQGDCIDQAGWDLAAYRKNPVVLFAHDYTSLPIARASAIYVAGDKLKAVDRFSDDHQLARECAALYAKGFLNAVSVGFRALKWSWNETRGSMAADYQACELLEHSGVPVPAHQDALIEARSAGLSIGAVLKWATMLIESSDSGLFVPRESLKSVVQGASTRVVVDFGATDKSIALLPYVEPVAVEPPAEPVEITVEAAMSRIAKAGFAVVDPAVLAKLTAPPVAPVAVEPAAEPVEKSLAEIFGPNGIRDLLRAELSTGTNVIREFARKHTGLID